MEYPEVVRKSYGSPMDLQCAATGDPPPLISWLKGGTPVSEHKLTDQTQPHCEYVNINRSQTNIFPSTFLFFLFPNHSCHYITGNRRYVTRLRYISTF